MSLNLDRSMWHRVKFGDVVRNVNENVKDPKAAGIDRVIGLEHMDPGELRIERWGELTEETTFTRRVKPGQTLFGKRRAYQRKTAYSEFSAVCSGDILVFESADPQRLLPELLPFIAMTDGFYAKALETSAGSLSPRTRWSDLASYEFDLPTLVDQERIADLLRALTKHTATEEARLSALEEVFRVKLRILSEELPHKTPITELADILDSLRVPVNESERALRMGSVPYYGAGGQVGTIDDALFDEDLVLVGEDATLAVYRISGPSWVNNHAHVLRPRGISQNALFYALKAIDVERFATNGTRLKLTRGGLESIFLPSASELEIYAADIQEIEEATFAARASIDAAKDFQKSLINELLEGGQ